VFRKQLIAVLEEDAGGGGGIFKNLNNKKIHIKKKSYIFTQLQKKN
jgi:hypothetical protein